MSLREEIETIIHEDFADKPMCDGCQDKALRIISVFEKRIDLMIKPYTDSETMLGKETLNTLQEVKEMLK